MATLSCYQPGPARRSAACTFSAIRDVRESYGAGYHFSTGRPRPAAGGPGPCDDILMRNCSGELPPWSTEEGRLEKMDRAPAGARSIQAKLGRYTAVRQLTYDGAPPFDAC